MHRLDRNFSNADIAYKLLALKSETETGVNICPEISKPFPTMLKTLPQSM